MKTVTRKQKIKINYENFPKGRLKFMERVVHRLRCVAVMFHQAVAAGLK